MRKNELRRFNIHGFHFPRLKPFSAVLKQEAEPHFTIENISLQQVIETEKVENEVSFHFPVKEKKINVEIKCHRKLSLPHTQ